MKAMKLKNAFINKTIFWKRLLSFISFLILFSSCTNILRGIGVIKKPKALSIESMLEVGVSHGLAIENIYYYFPEDSLNIIYPYWPEKLVEEDGFAYVFDTEGYLIDFESYCVGHPLKYLDGEIDSAMFKFPYDSIPTKVHLRDFLFLEGWQLLAAKNAFYFENISTKTHTVVVYWSRWQHYFSKRNIRDFISLNLPADSVHLIFINTDPLQEWYKGEF